MASPINEEDDGDDEEVTRSKPAITILRENLSHHDPYWNQSDLQTWATSNSYNKTKVMRDCDEDVAVVEISYSDLLKAASGLALDLGNLLTFEKSHELHTSTSNTCISNRERTIPVIGIAIPQGPYLPLVVLAVHLLQLQSKNQVKDSDISEKDDQANNPADGNIWNESLFENESIQHLQPWWWTKTPRHKNDAQQQRRPNSLMIPSGAILVPLDPSLGNERLRYMLQNSKPHLLLTVHKENNASLQRLGSVVDQLRKDYVQVQTKKHETDMELEHGENCPYWNIVDVATLLTESPRKQESGEIQQSNTTQPKPHTPTQNYYSKTNPALSPSPNYISHMVYTSGTTASQPKACTSSLTSLLHYLFAKTSAHNITKGSKVWLASSLSFDPCFSDILSTFASGATLAMAPLAWLNSGGGDGRRFERWMNLCGVTHVLCTPTLWESLTMSIQDEANEEKNNNIFSGLEVIALGGEPIPPQVKTRWARPKTSPKANVSTTRLLATYGVTEACVYQTCGEVYSSSTAFSSDGGTQKGDVGLPLEGMHVGILEEPKSTTGEDAKSAFGDKDDDKESPLKNKQGEQRFAVGEIVLFGNQVDACSGYHGQSVLSKEKFIRLDPSTLISSTFSAPLPTTSNDDNCNTSKLVYAYRTGDRGYIHPETRHVHMLGRIDAGDASDMVKYKGVRVQLSEVASAIEMTRMQGTPTQKGSSQGGIVLKCLVRLVHRNHGLEKQPLSVSTSGTMLVAYCVLSPTTLQELGLNQKHFSCLTSTSTSESDTEKRQDVKGIICPHTEPLSILLHYTCQSCVPPGCTPSAFVLLDQLPLSATGKCDVRRLPHLSQCWDMLDAQSIDMVPDGRDQSNETAASPARRKQLCQCGPTGLLLSTTLCEILNLSDAQRISSKATYALLGGDSLAATRVIRKLYAVHEQVPDSRLLGGEYGTLKEDWFHVRHLLNAMSLGEYVEFLDQRGFGTGSEKEINTEEDSEKKNGGSGMDIDAVLDQPIPEDGKDGFSAASTSESLAPANATADSNTIATQAQVLHEALMEATSRSQITVAQALLSLMMHNGALDQTLNSQSSNGASASSARLGKVRSRKERQAQFRSTPLHLACRVGNPVLVEALVQANVAWCKVPDATGSFPIHLACSAHNAVAGGGTFDGGGGIHAGRDISKEDSGTPFSQSTHKAKASEEEDKRRLACVQILLQHTSNSTGTTKKLPLSIRDGNQQTVLHCTARSGHLHLLRYLLQEWKRAGDAKEIPVYTSIRHGLRYDFRDRWFRTAVHWAVLHGHTEVVRMLVVDFGCCPNPPKPGGGGGGGHKKKKKKKAKTMEQHGPGKGQPEGSGKTEPQAQSQSQVDIQGSCNNNQQAQTQQPSTDAAKKDLKTSTVAKNFKNRRTSVALETPMEICERLYGTTEGIGLQISNILRRAMDVNENEGIRTQE